MAILSSAEGNKFLFTNEGKLVQRWLPSATDKFFPKSDGNGNNEHLKTVRKLYSVILKGHGLRENVEFMDEMMKQHLQSDWENKVQVTADDMATWLAISADTNTYRLSRTVFGRGIKASKLMHRAVEAMVRQRKIDLFEETNLYSKKDFMSRMLLATDDNGHFFSETDIASHLVSLVQG
ncbi:dammarenediol 12-hydroxylase-like [Coffea arabica]|uniref:Dammarenediol 12-hydroxylase-like n=1 Tax=Coffea arabica TaxID=13443 RepID=A0A6P6SF71_COFAR|nr:dammarenediol 12-hydroxylase-like [Coffea arabica]